MTIQSLIQHNFFELIRRGALWVPVKLKNGQIVPPRLYGKLNSSLMPYFFFRTRNFDSARLPIEHHVSFEYTLPPTNDGSIQIQVFDPAMRFLEDVFRGEWNAGNLGEVFVEFGWLVNYDQGIAKDILAGNKIANVIIASVTSIGYDYNTVGPTITLNMQPATVRLQSFYINTESLLPIKAPAHTYQFMGELSRVINESVRKSNQLFDIEFVVEYIGYETQPVDFSEAKSALGSNVSILKFLRWLIDNNIFAPVDKLDFPESERGGSRYAVAIPAKPDGVLSASKGKLVYKIYIIDKVYVEKTFGDSIELVFEWPSYDSPFLGVDFTISHDSLIMDTRVGVDYFVVDDDGQVRRVQRKDYEPIGGYEQGHGTNRERKGAGSVDDTNENAASKALITATFPMIGDPLIDFIDMLPQRILLTSPSIDRSHMFAQKSNFWNNFPQLSSELRARFPATSKIPTAELPFSGTYFVKGITHSIKQGSYTTTFNISYGAPKQ